MSDWATANLALRAARDEMDEAKRLEADARIARGTLSRGTMTRLADGDCGCEQGALCRANAACPRAVAAVRP